jgi:peptide chain release factor 2
MTFMHQYTKQAKDLLDRVHEAMEKLRLNEDAARLGQLEAQILKPEFWNEPAAAAKISQEAAGLKKHVEQWRELEDETKNVYELCQLNDTSLETEVGESLQKLEAKYAQKEFELVFSGQYDRGGAILSIYAGTGGTDAQDWAEMLLRMYLRYCEVQDFAVDVIDRSDGEEAGIKSVTVEVSGPFAYGKLKSEKGVHRLVRLSPFNSDNLRQTSFAMVEVIPQLDHPEEMEIDPADLRIDVYRAGGHGGQSVNTTDSAVRITHIPTGTTVAIQNERSQLQNKEKAMVILKAKLNQLMLEQQKAELSEIKGAPQSAEWGSQIRSYVLHPYTKVKDHRTDYETSQANDVLDGNLGGFIESYLKSKIGK